MAMVACLNSDRRAVNSKMATGQETGAFSKPTALNLRQWVDDQTLLSWIEAEIERFVPLSLGEGFISPDAADRFRKMMTLLCFAYSGGLTRSAEIVEALRTEIDFRFVTPGLRPFAEELRTFRRRYRAVLEVVLTRLFMRAATFNRQFAKEAVPRELENQFENRARNLLNLARHLDACDDC